MSTISGKDQYHDDTEKANYNWMRFYDMNSGRFNSIDPVKPMRELPIAFRIMKKRTNPLTLLLVNKFIKSVKMVSRGNTVGAWNQNDPTNNEYVYSANNPIKLVDTTGAFILNPCAPPCRGPANGKAGLQDNICTIVFGLHWGSMLPEEYQACCKKHDDCYLKNGCNSFSWFPPCGSSSCKSCNNDVVDCFIGNIGMSLFADLLGPLSDYGSPFH